MIKHNSTVAVFKTHDEAEEAMRALEESGFDMKKLSIVAKDFHTEENVVGYYNTGERMKFWGQQGAFWGGLWGMLFGSAFFWLPGLGPVVVAGPLVAWIVGALEGAVVVGGLSAVGAGLYSIGIAEDSLIQYENAISAGKFLVVAHGSEEEAKKAREVMQDQSPETMMEHKASELEKEI